VHVPAEQLIKAQVIPHPAANPTPRAATSGRPVSPPPVRNNVRNNGLAASRTASATDRVSAANRRPSSTARAPQPSSRIIIRSTPPPAPVPFAQRRAAMAEHPGRPLEPGQVQNLRSGRPVGPMFDREFPPHPGPVIRERAAPPRLSKPR
jgi:hypothetical protein